MFGFYAEPVFVTRLEIESLDALIYGTPRRVVVGLDEQYGLQRTRPVGDAQLRGDRPFADFIFVVLIAGRAYAGRQQERQYISFHLCRFSVRFLFINGEIA